MASPAQPAAASARVEAAPSLRSGFAWLLAGNLAYGVAQWAMVAMLARLGGPEVVGRFALGFAVCSPVFMLAGLRLREVVATDAGQGNRLADYLGLRALASLAALLSVGAIVLVAGYDGPQAAVILLVAAAKLSEHFSELFWGHFQQRERMGIAGRSMLQKAAISVVALGLTYALTHDLAAATLAMALAWLVLLLLYDVRVAARLPGADGSPRGLRALVPAFDRSILLPLFLTALPLGLYQVLATLQVNLPRYVLESRHGEAALGLFAAVVYLQIPGARVVHALGAAALPRLARHHAAGRRREYLAVYGRVLGLALVVGIGAVVAAVLFGRSILRLAYGPEFASESILLVWAMGAALLDYLGIAVTLCLLSLRRFRLLVPVYGISAATVLAAAVVMVPRGGALGAVQALALGGAVALAGGSWTAWRSLRGAWR